MAGTVHGMLMAGRILRDPLLVGAVAEHAEDDTTAAACFARIPRGPGRGSSLDGELRSIGQSRAAVPRLEFVAFPWVEAVASRVVAS